MRVVRLQLFNQRLLAKGKKRSPLLGKTSSLPEESTIDTPKGIIACVRYVLGCTSFRCFLLFFRIHCDRSEVRLNDCSSMHQKILRRPTDSKLQKR